jgi:4-hydroxythreonine-4-phosphate dehydrogenase
MTKPIIGITMGDPAGIGPEVILKSLAEKEIYRDCSPLVIGDGKVMARALKIARVPLSLHPVKEIKEADFSYGKVELLDLNNVEMDKFAIEKMSPNSGKATYEYIEKAVSLAKNGSLSAITTAPLNKEALNKAGINYPGHTEILAKLTATRRYAMMLAGDNLRIVLLTIHLSLKKALRLVTRERILEKIRLTHKALKNSFRIKKPSIAE